MTRLTCRPCRDSSHGGAEGIRTPDPLHAMEVRYQLRYSPGWVTPAGASVSLPMTPRTRPNRPQGGETRPASPLPTWRSTSGGAIRPALAQLGPVAVAESAEHPPGDLKVEAEQPGGGGAARRPVRGDDEALPRAEGGEGLLERRTDAAARRPSTRRRRHGARPRRAAAASCTSGQPSATSSEVRPCQAPAWISRKRGSSSTGMPHARPTLSAVSRARLRSEETMRSGERAAIAAPTASACSIPRSDSGVSSWPCQMPAALWSVSPWRSTTTRRAAAPGAVGLTDRPARCRRRRGRCSGSPSRAARARRRSAPRRAARGRRCRRSR